MKRFSILLLLLLPAMIFAQEKKEILTPQEFKSKTSDKSAIVLDVRTPDEFSQGHLAKAINKNVNDKDFDGYCATLDKGKTYLVYCLGGKRSHTAAEAMRKKGLTVFELEGGINNWNDAKLPVVK